MKLRKSSVGTEKVICERLWARKSTSAAPCWTARNISRATTLSSFPHHHLHSPSVAVIDVEHHDRNVLIVIVVLLRLVHELSLDLDDAVEGLVGDQSLVADVQLQQCCWPGTATTT